MKKYIISDREILGGEAVIKGTRIPARKIFFLLNDGFSPEAINELYPQLSVEIIKKVVEEGAQIINNHVSQAS
ncbi:MAG: DUF433 domain-containing protein [Candidatus Levybacteria bacterium]|nr:DUF433 domain-containing protein [Candidatus Levybacteria bacterium]